MKLLNGGVPERSNGTVSKIVVGETLPRVRIPAPPPSRVRLVRPSLPREKLKRVSIHEAVGSGTGCQPLLSQAMKR